MLGNFYSVIYLILQLVLVVQFLTKFAVNPGKSRICTTQAVSGI